MLSDNTNQSLQPGVTSEDETHDLSSSSVKRKRNISETREQAKSEVTGVTGGNVDNVVAAGAIHGDVHVENQYGPIFQSKTIVMSEEHSEKSTKQEHMREWLETDVDVFIETCQFRDAKKCLDTHGHVTIIGEAGSGKTSIGRHLLRLSKNDFCCLVIDKPTDLKQLRNPKVPTIALVDDVFGRSVYSHGELGAWTKELEAFRDGRLPERMKMIFTSRKYIFQEACSSLVLFKCTLFRDTSIVDLSVNNDTITDKETILNSYLEKEDILLADEDIKVIVNMDTPYGFPHACFLFSKLNMWHDKPQEFFGGSIHLFIETVEEFAKSDTDKFALLLLVLLNDGQLNIANLNEESKETKLIQKYIKNLDVSAFVRRRHQAASCLIDSYLISSGDIYSFRHPTVEDTIAYVIGKNDPRFLIEHCSSRVVCDRVRIQTEGHQPTQADQTFFHVVLADEYHDDLILKFVLDILKGRHSMIAVHQACTNKEFVGKLFVSLKSRCQEINISLDRVLQYEDESQKILYWSVLSLSDVLCSMIIATATTNVDDVITAIIMCCFVGNVAALMVLMKHLSPGLRKRLQHTECVTYYIDSDESGDLDVKTKNEKSILHAACCNGHINVVLALVEIGFSVNSDDEVHGTESLLHSSCEGGHVEVISYLLENGAHLEVKSGPYERTALHVCCEHGHLNAVKKCLEKGANLEMRDRDERTPLLIACKNGFPNIVEYLVQENADVHAKDNKGLTPILTACSYGHENIVEYLKGEGASFEDVFVSSLLHFACYNRRSKVVEELLDDQGDTNKNLNSVLLLCASRKPFLDKEHFKCDISRKLFEKGANVDYVDKMGMTPLLAAAEGGYMNLMSIFLGKGARLDVSDNDGQTVLHKLAKQSSSRILRECILNIKAGVNVVDNRQQTPLHIAARWGRQDTIQVLLENGADFDAVDDRKQTPLHLAAKWEEDVQLLLQANANVNAFDDQHQTPLHLAAGSGDIQNMQRLLENQGDVNVIDYLKQTPLHLAARWGSDDGVQKLVDGRADVNALDHHNQTPLHLAAGRSVEWVRVLMKGEANVHAVDDIGLTPLHVASAIGDVDSVELLLNKGANPNVLDNRKWTPFHFASASADTKTIQLLLKPQHSILTFLERMPFIKNILKTRMASLLLKHKDGVSATDVRKSTALHMAAASEGSADAIRLLLDEGADVNAEDDQKCTPLHIAAATRNPGAVQLLIDHKSDIRAVNINKQTPLHMASGSGVDITVQILLDNRADINVGDCYKQTPLHLAAVNGRTSTVGVLLEHEASINAMNSGKQTPLHIATCKKHFKMVKLLLNKGADVSALDNNKQTPLHIAAEHDNPLCVEILLDHKADALEVDAQNETPLYIAAECGREDNISKMLIAQRFDFNLGSE